MIRTTNFKVLLGPALVLLRIYAVHHKMQQPLNLPRAGCSRIASPRAKGLPSKAVTKLSRPRLDDPGKNLSCANLHI